MHVTERFSVPVFDDVQHEAIKAEMSGKQHELDQFSTKGKQLVVELKKIPDCDSQMLKKDVDTLVDQWLDVSSSSGPSPVSMFRFNSNLCPCFVASDIKSVGKNTSPPSSGV